ncbi:DNA/RNA helicase domain-containing protein, partial [Ferroplasma acidiphilum]|uniref:DNA/RNA helicase domain-containing protein n=1 Tax=Ferroplasma acidiphilum TaxID=74969 RepID=UPI001F388641
MVASLRKLLDSISSGMSTLIKYYSTGRPGNPGVAEDKFPVHYDIAIFDESQRMTVKNIENAGKVADISVFFYDDSQILGTREQGTQSNFLKYLENPHEITLKGLYRNGNEYGEFVNKLLEGESTIYPEQYDLQYFADIKSLINALKTKIDHGKKSALVASFTEAKGNIHDINSQDNIRIGNKIPSGLNLYDGTGIEVKWLMDPKKEYAPFWVGRESNKLEKCASVYGAQGFEADYTGVIWGRDLVRRDNKWVLGDNCQLPTAKAV